MKKKICIAVILAVLYSCSEVYRPDVETVEPFLVVEGFISTKPGSCLVTLSKSQSYNENTHFKGQEGATVIVTDDQGKPFNYEETGNGGYRLQLPEGNTAEIERTYTLRITTPEGDVFESTPQKIVPCPPLRSLFCNYGQQTILTEDAYGSAYEITYNGISIIAETDGILPSDNYYLYAWRAYEEHHTVLQYQVDFAPPINFDLFQHRLLSGKYSNNIHTANADEYDNFRLRNSEVLFIVRDDMTNYTPVYPDTLTFISTDFQGLFFLLKQKSLSADAYSFYNDIEKQLGAEGRLFDPISPQIAGNINCVNDGSKKVIGVFYASDEVEKISYFYINYRNRTISRDIDSLPELWIDTCSWSQPDDWIIPSY